MRRRKIELFPYLLIAPVVIYLLAFYLIPFLQGVSLSFYDISFAEDAPFTGLSNYIKAFTDHRFYRALSVSLIYTFGVLGFLFASGLLVALIVNQNFQGRSVVRTLLTLPWVIPMVCAALIWFLMCDPTYGVLNYLLTTAKFVDQPRAWLVTPSSAMFILILFSAWKSYPMAALVLLAGLQSISAELYEAARVDGAGIFRRFWNITIPGLRSVSSVLLLILFLESFTRAFSPIFMLTGGGPVRATETLTVAVYFYGFRRFQMGYGAAIATIVAIIALAITSLYVFWMEKKE